MCLEAVRCRGRRGQPSPAMTKISDMTVEYVAWAPRYKCGHKLLHRESGKPVVVKEFEHQGYYLIDRYLVLPVYLVWVTNDQREAYVAEYELTSRPNV